LIYICETRTCWRRGCAVAMTWHSARRGGS